MSKQRVYKWARDNGFKTADILTALKKIDKLPRQASSMVDDELLDQIKAERETEKKRIKKSNYRRNLYQDRKNRGYFCIDDVLEHLELENELSEDIKMALGIEVSRKFKKSQGFNGYHLVNIYKIEFHDEIIELVKTLV